MALDAVAGRELSRRRLLDHALPAGEATVRRERTRGTGGVLSVFAPRICSDSRSNGSRERPRCWGWVVGLRLATGAVLLALSLVDGIAPLVLAAAIAAVVVAEVAFELQRAPAEPAQAAP
jgi:hypothetical protein